MTNLNGRRSQRHPDEQELRRTVDRSIALQRLLAAAAAPPSTTDLRGRSRAVADFRAVHRPSLDRLGQPRQLKQADQLKQVGQLGQVGPTPAASHPHRNGSVAKPASGRLTAMVPGSRSPGPRFARVGRWSAAQLTVACAALITVLGGTAAAAAAGELPVPVQNAVAQFFNGTLPAGVTGAPASTAPNPSAAGTSAAPASPAPNISRRSGSGAAASRSAAPWARRRQSGSSQHVASPSRQAASPSKHAASASKQAASPSRHAASQRSNAASLRRSATQDAPRPPSVKRPPASPVKTMPDKPTH